MSMGLLWGLTPWHIRVLVDGEWSGGRGISLEEVGRMTIDQVILMLVDRQALKERRKEMDAADVNSLPSVNGKMPGVAEDGTKIFREVKGKSYASRLAEEAAARRAAEPVRRGRRRR